ncbi:MAG: hypothetical protein Q4B67_01255 [Eubacteriales bacterium]|nr:hypothetical protein [Eubacteriales bacterium]
MKKLFNSKMVAWFMCLCLIMGSMPVTAMAESGTTRKMMSLKVSTIEVASESDYIARGPYGTIEAEEAVFLFPGGAYDGIRIDYYNPMQDTEGYGLETGYNYIAEFNAQMSLADTVTENFMAQLLVGVPEGYDGTKAKILEGNAESMNGNLSKSTKTNIALFDVEVEVVGNTGIIWIIAEFKSTSGGGTPEGGSGDTGDEGGSGDEGGTGDQGGSGDEGNRPVPPQGTGSGDNGSNNNTGNAGSPAQSSPQSQTPAAPVALKTTNVNGAQLTGWNDIANLIPTLTSNAVTKPAGSNDSLLQVDLNGNGSKVVPADVIKQVDNASITGLHLFLTGAEAITFLANTDLSTYVPTDFDLVDTVTDNAKTIDFKVKQNIGVSLVFHTMVPVRNRVVSIYREAADGTRILVGTAMANANGQLCFGINETAKYVLTY